jgi:hypothetical protein
MASGLSVEAQFTTLFVVIFAPILGYIADLAGVGLALAIFGMGMLVLYLFIRVGEPQTVAAGNHSKIVDSE